MLWHIVRESNEAKRRRRAMQSGDSGSVSVLRASGYEGGGGTGEGPRDASA